MNKTSIKEKLIFDNFCGGGGANTGIERALNRPVDHAVNHSWEALGMHRINHPTTVHHQEDVFEIDPARIAKGQTVGMGWFSPDCKFFSKAAGGRPLDKKVRALAFVIFRYAAIRTECIFMENVEEIQKWGPLLPNNQPDPKHTGRTWKAFVNVLGKGITTDHPDIPEMLEVLNNPKYKGTPITVAQLVRGFGYHVEFKEIRASDLGTPTIRKRLFMIARCDGKPIVWPEATHANPALGLPLKPWKTIAHEIDWDIPCNSIFLTKAQAKKANCKRPLARSTEQRIAIGVDRYVLKAAQPCLVNLTHQGGDRVEPVTEPAMTITGAHRGEKAVVDASVVPFIDEHANASNQRVMPGDEPLRTLCAQTKGGHFSLVAANMVQKGHLKSNSKMSKGGNEPMRTQTTRAEHALIATSLGVLTSGHPGGATVEPLKTVATGGHHVLIAASLAREFGESIGGPADKPAPTVMPGGGGKTALIATHLTKFNTGSVGSPADGPAPTVTAGTHAPDTHGGAASTLGVVAANLVKFRGDVESHNAGIQPNEPLHTSSAGGQHHGLSLAYLAQHNGGFNTTPGHPVTEPVSSLTATGSQQQVVAASMAAYYGSEKDGQGVNEAMRTQSCKPRFGLALSEAVAPPMTEAQIKGAHRVAKFLRKYGVEFEGEFATVGGFVVVDIGMRMLTPRELFRAQGFDDSYVIDRAWVIDPKTGSLTEVWLTKEQQIRMCGNSVCPPVAEALVRANVPELIRKIPAPEQKVRVPMEAAL